MTEMTEDFTWLVTNANSDIDESLEMFEFMVKSEKFEPWIGWIINKPDCKLFWLVDLEKEVTNRLN